MEQCVKILTSVMKQDSRTRAVDTAIVLTIQKAATTASVELAMFEKVNQRFKTY